MTVANPWHWWPAQDIARIIGCPLAAVKANWPLIADALERRGIYDRDVCLGVLPTVAIETASTFESIHEYGTAADWAGYEGGVLYAGRSFPQLTHLGNYRQAGEALGLDLVGNPNLVLDPKVGADVLAWFWATKGVPAKDRSHFYTMVELCHQHDYEWVRRVFQGGTAGLDRLIAMASALDAYASKEQSMPTQLAYNPTQSPERQIADWVCSIRSTAWVLKSLGLPVDIGALQDEMSPTYVTPALGLLDRRGYGIAEVLKAHLPADWQDRVHVFETITWDELRSIAGSGPIALGLHGAYHWIDVARVRDDGDLDAANPAPGYPISAPIGDVLSRPEFDRFGPASAVWVQVPVAAPETAPPVEIVPDDKVPGLISAVAYLADNVAAIEDRDQRLAEARRVREQYVGVKVA